MTPKPKKEVRVRIAPSPTGNLHIGTARTALFNWLFARNQGGKFILRVEDTDLERSNPKYEKDIIENLKWLGLDWDEGPYRQSERLDTYERYINQLLEKELAYYCDCTEDELEAQRQAMMAQGLAPKYSGKCRSRALKTGAVIRFKIPESKISFNDLIRGELSFDGALIGDMAIAKGPRAPLYNFAVVVDDYEMQISHVIRGEDHIANTPRQLFIQKALGFNQPEYAHLPLILNPDRSKISKRFAATSIKEYKEAGYLPDALINFMALLGWHPAPQPAVEAGKSLEREIFSLQELVHLFDIKRVQKAGAAFNIDKLDWLNAQYIKKLSDQQLADLLDIKEVKIIPLFRDRIKKLSDFRELADFFYSLSDYPAELLIWKGAPAAVIRANLEAVLELLPDADKIMKLAEERGKGEVLWPLRAALSGKDASPGPLELIEVLGEKEAAKRIKIAINKLSG